jgi:hypothetical protein
MIRFADDSTGQVNSFRQQDQPTPEFLRTIMQYDAQLWSNLLWVSGGLLKLGKFSFHQIHFDFAPDGTPSMRAGIYGTLLQVHDAALNENVTILAKSVYTPHKTLGHHEAPAGENVTQHRVLHRNSNTYAKLVATSPLNRSESWFFYTAIYLKSLGYVLSNCFFSELELKTLQNSATRAFLAKCGYNRNTQRTIVFAPIRFSGCGFLRRRPNLDILKALAHQYRCRESPAHCNIVGPTSYWNQFLLPNRYNHPITPSPRTLAPFTPYFLGKN